MSFPHLSKTIEGQQGSIALNGRFTGTRMPTGTQTAAFHLFDAIVRSPRSCTLTIFADSRYPEVTSWKDYPQVKWVEIPFQDWSRTRSQLWELIYFTWLARQAGCQLCHHPINTSPLWDNGLNHFVTLHDLNFLTHPEWYNWSFRTFLRHISAPRLRLAKKVVVVSKYVQQQALEHLELNPEQVQIVHNGVKPRPLLSAIKKENAHLVQQPHLLCVGSLQPHKNLPRLIAAFRLLRSEGLVSELKIVGRAQKNFAQMPELKSIRQEPGLTFTGYLSESELFQAYEEASVFCYPSLEEGFGLPILEAMLNRVLVVTSSTSCLPEIAGPAATLVDPTSVTSIAQGIRDCLLLDPEKKRQKLDLSESWAKNFSWNKAAQEYLALYQELTQCP